MTIFSHTTGFTRGEVAEALYDRVDVDFYKSASRFMQDWFPDLTGSISRRPGWQMAELTGGGGSVAEVGTGAILGETLVNFTFRDVDYICLLIVYTSAGVTRLRIVPFQVESGAEFSLTKLSGAIYDVQIAATEITLPKALTQLVSYAFVGPSMFIASTLFPVTRVFVNLTTMALQIEQVSWREELLGTVEIATNTAVWTGTDTLLNEQLTVGATFYFRGQAFTVASFDVGTPATKMTSNETYTGITIAGERITKANTDPFGDGQSPGLVTFHKGRLHLFSTMDRPTTWWASKAQDPFTIVAGSVYDDAPIEYDLLTADADQFLWVQALDGIYLGGSRGEYLIDAPSDSPLTPTGFSFRRVSTVGGASVDTFVAETMLAFMNRGRTQLFRIRFDDNSQGFIEQDLSLLAPHLLEGKVKDLAFRPANKADRVPRIFLIDDQAQMRACALQDQQNVAAWSRVSSPDPLTPLAVSSSSEQVYVLTQDVNSPLNYRILRLEEDTTADYWVMDLQRTYTFGSTVTVDPIFANYNVAVVTPEKGFLGFFPVNASAEIDFSAYIDSGITEVHVGFSFSSKLEMLPVAIADQRGERLNRKRRVVRVLVSVRDSYQIYVAGNLLFGSVATQGGTELPTRSGTFEMRLLGWSYRDLVVIESATIYRAQVLSVTREVNQ